MPNVHETLSSLFTDIAEAIRSKDGTSENIIADTFPDRIAAIDTDPSGDATATSNDILSPKTAYAQGEKITGTIVTKNDQGLTKLDTTTISKSFDAGYYPSQHGAQIELQNSSITPSESTQVLTPSAGKVLNTVTIEAIPSEYVGTGVTRKESDVYYPSTVEQRIDPDQYLDGYQVFKPVITSNINAQNIKSGVLVEVGDIDDSDRILGITGTFTDQATISGSKIPATSGDILTGKAAFMNGAQLDGTMPNNGSISETITTQGGSVTIPSGYTSGGTVTADIPVTTLTNSIISGASFEEQSGDFGWRSTVQIPAGMHEAQTLVKEFSDVFPAPQSEGSSGELLSGYQLYDHSGRLITGTMTNNGATSATLDTSTTIYTIPAGYHNGSGTVDISLQSKTVNPLESVQTVVPDTGKVLSEVTVAAVADNYVGSAIVRNPELVVNENIVTVPVGYYSASQRGIVNTAVHPAPSISTSLDTTNHELVITASHTQNAGYVSQSTTTDTDTIQSVPASTITPTESIQTAVDANKYTEGAITVAAISPTYVGSQVEKKAAATYYPSSLDQVISSGQYLNGNQTIAAVTTNITADKILAGYVAEIGDSLDSDRVLSLTGTFSADGTATAGDIANGKTAYVNGTKITGTMTPGTVATLDYAPGKAGLIYLGNNAEMEDATTIQSNIGSVSEITTDHYMLELA